MTHDPHDSLLVLDSHVDIPWPPNLSPFEDGPRCVDLPKLKQGRVSAVCFAAYIPQGRRDDAAHLTAAARARAMLDTIEEMAPSDGSGGLFATSAALVEAAHAAGKPAITPAIENGYAIGRSLALLEDFARRGVRYMTLTHNGHNEIADAAIALPALGDKEQEYGGLSDFGQEVVSRMNDLGMLIDISHAAKSTMMQAAKRSRVPVVATHSCMRALCDHKRNLDDEQLELLAATGGVVQVTIVSNFLRPKAHTEDVSVEDIIDHIDYAVKRMGIDHVGIGTDFDGGGGVREYVNAAQTPVLTAALARRGYGRVELEKLWGGNFLRLMRKAEEASITKATAATTAS